MTPGVNVVTEGVLLSPVGSVPQSIDVIVLENPLAFEWLPGICQIVFPWSSVRENWYWKLSAFAGYVHVKLGVRLLLLVSDGSRSVTKSLIKAVTCAVRVSEVPSL